MQLYYRSRYNFGDRLPISRLLISCRPTSHDKFYALLRPVPAHPALGHASLFCSVRVGFYRHLSSPASFGSLYFLPPLEKEGLNAEQVAEIHLCYDLSSLMDYFWFFIYLRLLAGPDTTQTARGCGIYTK